MKTNLRWRIVLRGTVAYFEARTLCDRNQIASDISYRSFTILCSKRQPHNNYTQLYSWYTHTFFKVNCAKWKNVFNLQNTDTGDKYYPYVLNGTTITNGENHADNVEKIEVDNLPSGNYKLVVSGANLQDSSSEFAVACSKAIFDKSDSSITLKTKLQTKSFARVIMDSMY